MSQVLAQAPGKAVLIGEYAVLHGAPALAMAVNRHARVRIRACAADQCRVSAPQLGSEPVGFSVESGSLAWDIEAAGWPALRQSATMLSFLHGLVVERFGDPGPFSLEIDTGELFIDTAAGPVKLGLGSSSAVAVALDAGLRRFAGGPAESGLSMRALRRLLRPYRRGQDGQGSGIDLASCLCGGVIAYQRHDDEPVVSRLSLPENLALMFIWTGQAASTPDLLEQYQAWRRREAAEAGSLQADMTRVCQAAQAAMIKGDAEALVEHFRCYGGLMGTMGGLMGVDLLGAEHGRVRARAEQLGLAYKPCGAGLGDLGMVAAADPARLHDMRRWLDQSGIPVLPLAMDAQGVQVVIERD
jgi:phosphomevalonate kinase